MSTSQPTRFHTINRTSPKGKGMPFIGTCPNCGARGLTLADMDKECPNQRGITQDEALIEAIDGRHQ